jgi:uncharacterized protein YecE (DUF72 family)
LFPLDIGSCLAADLPDELARPGEGAQDVSVADERIAGCPPEDGAIVIGTAGWNIPVRSGPRFAGEGTHLQRYARCFRGAEINSSFHRPHARTTYQKWAAATPDGFRFAVKLTREITHDARLMRSSALLERFLDETSGLGHKRGPILVQLPPSLAFGARIAGRFFDDVRRLYDGPLVCEPRHATWALPAAEKLLTRYRVARVAADPSPVPTFGEPGGWDGIVYFRLHGAPRTYWSPYSSEYLETLASTLRTADSAAVWCVFDNTASGVAIENALELQHAALHARSSPTAATRPHETHMV